MKLKLDIKKITAKDIKNYNKFNINNNTFTTFVKKTNLLNNTFIYTNFSQNIENITRYDFSNVSVKAMVIDNIGRLYVGGDFNKIGNLTCNRIAMWDGKKWNSLGDGLNGQVISLGIDGNNNLFVGGSFGGTYDNLIKSNSIIMWNSYNKKWVSLDGGVNGNVASINTLSNGNIVIAGSFTSSINSSTYLEKIAYWKDCNWINLGGDFLIDKNIYASTIDKFDNIYIGGYNDLPVSIYIWTTKQWNKLISKDSNELTQIVNTIIINPTNSNPIFGGIIENFGTVTNVFNVVEFDIILNQWIGLTNSDGFGLNSQCYKLFYDKINKQILAGGGFNCLSNGIDDGLVLNNVAKWNGYRWENLGVGINGNNVESFEITSNNELFIGGNIIGSENIWANGIVIYTNNYINLFYKHNLLYTLTNFKKSITISINKCLSYIFESI